MVKARCQDCGEVIECKKSDVEDNSCDCGGSYAILGSEDDEYEFRKCPVCPEEIKGMAYTCNECDKEICKNCIIKFENSDTLFCKSCIDKVYPRQIETKVEYKEVEKIIKVYVDKDGTPLNTQFNPNNKSRFD